MQCKIVERRQEYMTALEQASVDENIETFARFIESLIFSL